MKPAVDGTTSPLRIAIPEEAANSLVEFDASSIYPIALPGRDYLISICINLFLLEPKGKF